MSINYYEHAIHAVDTHYLRPQFDAAHIIIEQGRVAIVDCGTSHSVPRILAALEALGVAREAVDWLLITHVHLDHAGGAGQLMQALPNARAVLHPRGAPHMIDPAKLIAASRAVYGDAVYEKLYGDILPIDAQRVHATTEGERIDLAGRGFQVLHTPGHAMHHHVFFDERSKGVFTGDTFGLSYREFDVEGRAFAFPTTTPTQFDPDQLIDSIQRIMALEPTAAYLTHYGRITDLPRIAESLIRMIGDFAYLARAQAGKLPDEAKQALREGIHEVLRGELARHGCTLPEAVVDEVLELDLQLNTDGLLVWLARAQA
jgi:glyoxylase-like metal-dependent hydrolase (beta-lactamase superfamily II)